MKTFVIILCVMVLLCVIAYYKQQTNMTQSGGLLSVRAGPVDMLQFPRQTLMDGYRFQDTLFPVTADNLLSLTDCQPVHRQRVGVFKSDGNHIVPPWEDQVTQQVGGTQVNGTQIGGAIATSAGTISQLNSRGEQDKYLMGRHGQVIIDSDRPFGLWVGSAPVQPLRQEEVNYPNKVFSWGDVLHRYRDQTPLSLSQRIFVL